MEQYTNSERNQEKGVKMKLKTLSMHKIENVPDHVLQEMQDFAIKLTVAVKPYIDSVSPNIALAGLNWMVPVIIKLLVTENPDELRKAIKISCSMLLNNMELLIKQIGDKKDEREL